jgi:hypothetical protein
VTYSNLKFIIKPSNAKDKLATGMNGKLDSFLTNYSFGSYSYLCIFDTPTAEAFEILLFFHGLRKAHLASAV